MPSGRHRTEALLRFDLTERLVHWATAGLVLALFATGAILYIPALSLAVGDRLVIEDLHIACGVASFGPLLVGLLGPWGKRLRRDLRAMNRLTAAESSWLRSLGARERAELGKFNPGQKLNAVTVAALLAVLLVTGLILRWGNFLAVNWRTGATFVHDWFALAIVVLILGHVLFAVVHPGALRAMVTGTVTSAWRQHHAPRWEVRADELRAADGTLPGTAPTATLPGDPAPSSRI